MVSECRPRRAPPERGSRSVRLRAPGAHRLAVSAHANSCRSDYYAGIAGIVDGLPVVALVRRDGSVSADRPLMRRVDLVVALEDTIAAAPVSAGVGVDPLVTTLTATRACDSVSSVVLFAAGDRTASALPPRANGKLADGPGSNSDLLHIQVFASGDAHVVRLRGELDIASAGKLRDALTRLADSSVVVDISGVSFLDAGALSALLAARRDVQAKGSELTVRGAQGLVRRVFEITELTELLEE